MVTESQKAIIDGIKKKFGENYSFTPINSCDGFMVFYKHGFIMDIIFLENGLRIRPTMLFSMSASIKQFEMLYDDPESFDLSRFDLLLSQAHLCMLGFSSDIPNS
jgi:hypothetical protein